MALSTAERIEQFLARKKAGPTAGEQLAKTKRELAERTQVVRGESTGGVSTVVHTEPRKTQT